MTSDTKDFEGDVTILKEWYSKQPHLPQNISEHYFYNFVSGTKSLEKAKQKMDAYLSIRTDVLNLLPDSFHYSKAFKDYMRANYMVVLPDKTPEGHRVMFSKISDISLAEHLTASPYFFRTLVTTEIAYSLWPTDTSYIVIHDYHGVDIGATKSLDFKVVAGLAKLLNKGIPIKVKSVHVINTPGFVEAILRLLRPLVSAKLNERITTYKDDSPVREVLPKSMVPKEYGGEGKSIKELGGEWQELIESRMKWLDEKLELRSDEARRPKESFARETLDFGLEGSFKSLSFD